MTGNDLVKFITENKLENSTIYLGCQGYINQCDDIYDELYIDKFGNDLLIHDNCFYKEVNT